MSKQLWLYCEGYKQQQQKGETKRLTVFGHRRFRYCIRGNDVFLDAVCVHYFLRTVLITRNAKILFSKCEILDGAHNQVNYIF